MNYEKKLEFVENLIKKIYKRTPKWFRAILLAFSIMRLITDFIEFIHIPVLMVESLETYNNIIIIITKYINLLLGWIDLTWIKFYFFDFSWLKFSMSTYDSHGVIIYTTFIQGVFYADGYYNNKETKIIFLIITIYYIIFAGLVKPGLFFFIMIMLLSYIIFILITLFEFNYFLDIVKTKEHFNIKKFSFVYKAFRGHLFVILPSLIIIGVFYSVCVIIEKFA